MNKHLQNVLREQMTFKQESHQKYL